MPFSCTRVSFPVIQYAEDVQVEINSAAICQEITVSKFVSEAIERGLVQAEAEAAAEEVIHSKNHEISHLRDQLQYYEAVNREMSQRNQEILGKILKVACASLFKGLNL